MDYNLKIFEWSDEVKRNAFIKHLKIVGDISKVFKYYNDYNKNNYIACYIHVNEEDIFLNRFNEKLYNEYHLDYLKYYYKNPNIKFIVFTNNIYSYKWCKIFFKFFNTFYYYM